MRGEYSAIRGGNKAYKGSLPLARGIQLIRNEIVLHAGITPACAGNTLCPSMSTANNEDHPRLRGEYPKITKFTDKIFKSPPLARGIPPAGRTDRNRTGITPACAGNTLLLVHRIFRRQDHPRLRGEYKRRNRSLHGTRGSPPLARGIRRRSLWSGDFSRITPACAGNTHQPSQLTQLSRDHPRLRGEYCCPIYSSGTRSGSPPLARGIPNLPEKP